MVVWVKTSWHQRHIRGKNEECGFILDLLYVRYFEVSKTTSELKYDPNGEERVGPNERNS